MVRLADGSILCAFERDGETLTTKSLDDGRSWQAPKSAATFEYGIAANPELLVVVNGDVLLAINERPNDGEHPFAIRTYRSHDHGESWQKHSPAYEASVKPDDGCWEPAALQLPSGEIQLFFANEHPYPTSAEQEISMVRSFDNGSTWGEAIRVSFCAGARDGMPVPLLLNDGETIVVSIEDNGRGRLLQPSMIATPVRDNWSRGYVSLDSPLRWQPLRIPLEPGIYAGAPYIRQMPGGETILSCHSNEGREPPVMVVYVGDSQARGFTNRTQPFTVDEGHSALWNSLFVKNRDVITAISSTTIGGNSGIWAIDGNVVDGREL